MNNHAPIPWKLWNGFARTPQLTSVERIGPEGSGGIVARGADISGTTEDLEFIIRAVNSYDALRAAAKAAQNTLANIGRKTQPVYAAYTELGIAIALAEGKA